MPEHPKMDSVSSESKMDVFWAQVYNQAQHSIYVLLQ